MSLAAFAGRLGLASSSTAHQIEQAEVQGTISVRRLRAAANALGCDLAVVLVPRKPLARQVEERAREVAAAQLARAGHSMQLEQQGVDAEQFEVLLKVAADELLRGPGARLWDEV